MFFLVFNDNGSSIQEDTWKLPPGKTESEITDTERLDYEEVLFQLNVTGYGACQFPVSGATCRKGGIELVSLQLLSSFFLSILTLLSPMIFY